MAIELQLSVNTMIIGSIDSSVRIGKYTGASVNYSWSMKVSEVNRILGFGSVGRKVLAEDVAKRLSVDFTTAGELIKQVQGELSN
ncbi:hypothetical protein QCF74_gp43 [Escherichia phage SZH-1]|uniref:hypothetical protein n=1 Tax=Escherichia phage SZH-1 TaxID=2945916 RepID=UPI00218B22FB|nr:hypothetical protein QCF74_gp43 [Escherichia phage SZH-1]URG18179.1 hypothetical protein [Escherichia phage SZH-1]